MQCTAEYFPDSVPSTGRGNPLSEAIPPFPVGNELMIKLIKLPQGDFSIGSDHPAAFYEISSLLEINFPRLESPLLAMRILSMVHNSYKNQHPFAPETQRRLHSIDEDAFELNADHGIQCDAMLLLAWSGMGKSTLINSLLKLIPQVIVHTNYLGREFFQKQVVWLSVDGPNAGSPKGFLFNVARRLDEALGLAGPQSYLHRFSNKSHSVDTLRVLVATALATHHVGLLHIDDVQRFSEGNSETLKQAASTLIGLANICKCSLLFSGTPPALTVIQANFETTRRISRRGGVQIMTPTTIQDKFFRELMDFLFTYQFSKNPLIIDDELREKLLRLTAGVPAILTSLYVSTLEVSVLGRTSLTANLFDSVWQQQFAPLIPAVSALNTQRMKRDQGWNEETDKQLNAFLSGRKKEK